MHDLFEVLAVTAFSFIYGWFVYIYLPEHESKKEPK